MPKSDRKTIHRFGDGNHRCLEIAGRAARFHVGETAFALNAAPSALASLVHDGRAKLAISKHLAGFL
jgi:hypothetical protein